MRGIAWFLSGALAFGLAYCQAPLYYSNQNQYFLHGLANAGKDDLQDDWLANTADPTPVFSLLVTVTYRHLHEYAFHGYYLLLFGVYSASLVALFSFLAGQRHSYLLRLGFFAILLLVHSALVRFLSYRLFGWDYPWYFQSGLAGQYALGAMFQPSTFAVFLILSIALLVWNRPYWAVASLGLACAVHSTYLLGAGMLTLGFMLVLWREGQLRQAVYVGSLALLLVLPVVTYAAIAFRPTAADDFADAQQLLAHVRIPHHCLPRLWCDGIAVGQMLWMLLALCLVRRTRLFLLMGVPFLLFLGFTLLQIVTDNDALSLLFPWRISAVLMPIATTVILSRLILAGARWLDRPAAGIASAIAVAGLVVAGFVLTWQRQGFQTNDDELPLLEYVKANKARGDVYLLPAAVPNLKATTRGSLSSDFKPLAAKKTDPRIIPIDLQRFRLATGAALYVDFKSIPYKDSDVKEWYRRIKWNETMLNQLRAGKPEVVLAEFKREGVTHVVVMGDQKLKGAGSLSFRDVGVYRVYQVNAGKPGG